MKLKRWWKNIKRNSANIQMLKNWEAFLVPMKNKISYLKVKFKKWLKNLTVNLEDILTLKNFNHISIYKMILTQIINWKLMKWFNNIKNRTEAKIQMLKSCKTFGINKNLNRKFFLTLMQLKISLMIIKWYIKGHQLMNKWNNILGLNLMEWK